MAFYNYLSTSVPGSVSSPSFRRFTDRNFSFQRKVPLEQRKRLAAQIKTIHPDRIAVLLEIPKNATYLSSEWALLLKLKYLVPENITVGEFYKKLKMQLESDGSNHSYWYQRTFFLLTETQMPLKISDTITEVYEKYKNEDDLLYLYFCEENMFGTS